MEANKALQKDWSSLPAGILNLIAKDLREIPDFVRFRAVCTAWRSSTPIADLHPQFPWTLQIRQELNDPNLRFYSMSSDKVYTIHDPKYIGQFPYEISEGYISYKCRDKSQGTSTTQLSLLNPLNNDEIPLPACHCCPQFFPQRYSQIVKYGLPCTHFPFEGSHVRQLFHCRLGHDQWHRYQGELVWGDDKTADTHFCVKGMIFTFNRLSGFTHVTDIGTGSLAHIVPSVGFFTVRKCTFLDAADDILAVFRLYNGPADPLWEVRRLDVSDSGSACWVKVENIGNRALFVDVYGVFMLKADDSAGIKSNCIYNLYKDSAALNISSMLTYEVQRIDIQTGAKEFRQRLPDMGFHRCWFVPKLCRLRAE